MSKNDWRCRLGFHSYEELLVRYWINPEDKFDYTLMQARICKKCGKLQLKPNLFWRSLKKYEKVELAEI